MLFPWIGVNFLAVFGYAAGGITGHKKTVVTAGRTYPVDNNRYICGYC